jgi:hypothetical protein
VYWVLSLYGVAQVQIMRDTYKIITFLRLLGSYLKNQYIINIKFLISVYNFFINIKSQNKLEKKTQLNLFDQSYLTQL